MTSRKTTTLLCAIVVAFVLIIIFAYLNLPGLARGADPDGTGDSSSGSGTTPSSSTLPPSTSPTETSSDVTNQTTEPPASGTETEPPETTPEPTEIKLSQNSVAVKEGESVKVVVTLSPSGADPDKLSVTVSDEATATAKLSSGEIEITGVKAGSASVSVLYAGASMAEISVTVSKAGTTPLPPVQQSSDIDPTKPMIALTFDDGPGPHTDQLLDILKKYNVHATFFVQGVMFHKDRIPFMKRAVEEGNEIGIHTWNHKKLTDLSEADVREEILSVREYLEENIGYTPRLMRPPYGSYNDTVKKVCSDEGLIIVRWCVDTEDWKTKDPDKTYEAIMSTVKDGVIILCHDIHDETIAAMDRTIGALVEKGYQLVTVSEMLQYSEKIPQAGDVVKRK